MTRGKFGVESIKRNDVACEKLRRRLCSEGCFASWGGKYRTVTLVGDVIRVEQYHARIFKRLTEFSPPVKLGVTGVAYRGSLFYQQLKLSEMSRL